MKSVYDLQMIIYDNKNKNLKLNEAIQTRQFHLFS